MLQDPRHLDLHGLRAHVVTSPWKSTYICRRRAARSRSNRCCDGDSGHGVDGLAGAGSQLGNASDSGVIVEAVVDEETADHGRGTALAAPAVDVNDSAGRDFGSDASEDVVVAVVVDHAIVGNRIGVVPDLSSRLLDRELQCLSI